MKNFESDVKRLKGLAVKAIKAKAAVRCICGSNDFNMAGFSKHVISHDDDPAPEIVPIAIVLCEVCGLVRTYGLGPLGLLKEYGEIFYKGKL